MHIILFDTLASHSALLPLTFTRPVAALRVGVMTIEEKWGMYLDTSTSVLPVVYLNEKFPTNYADDNLYLNASVLPDVSLVTKIKELKPEDFLVKEGELIAFRTNKKLTQEGLASLKEANSVQYLEDIVLLKHSWNIFQFNGSEIRKDVEVLKEKKSFVPLLDEHTKCYAKENIFVEEGAEVKASILDASNGPIYIGKDAKVGIGSLVTGPFALCQSAHTNPGAKLRGDTTVGPFSKVGGELSNVVIQGYSNKGHEGFLGNAVLGEWCNLGADTNASNLKNNYSNVKIWNYQTGNTEPTDLKFCGLIMGDYSRSGINTMFNTATTVGIFSNIFGSEFPPKFIPSYSWGGGYSFSEFKLEKAFEMAETVMKRRGVTFTEEDKALFEHLFEATKKFRG